LSPGRRPRTLLLNGEAVAFDSGRLVSSSQLLQNGSQPVVFGAFDRLYVKYGNLREASLTARRAALEKAVGERRGPSGFTQSSGMHADL
jgi:ATP-dependent DNA ligase